MMRLDGRRLVRAIGLTFALFLLVGGGIGFVAAEGEEPGLHVPAPRPGDKALYEAHETVVDDTVLREQPGQILLDKVAMEWLPERTVQDADFRLRPARPLRVTYIFAEGTQLENHEVREFLYDAGTGEPILRSETETWSWCYASTPGVFIQGECIGTVSATVEESIRRDRYEGVLGPCGAASSLHGATYTEGDGPVAMPGACDWPGGQARLTYAADGWEEGLRGAAYGFTAREEPRLRLWYDEVSPFPVRASAVLGDFFAFAESTHGRFWDLQRIAEEAGEGAYAPAEPPAAPPAPIPMGAATPWLLDDSGMGLPFTLDEAVSAALAQVVLPTTTPSQSSAGQWLPEHPEAYLAFAIRLEFIDRHGQRNPVWSLLWIDHGSGDWLGKWVSQRPYNVDGLTVPEGLGRTVEVEDWRPAWLPGTAAARRLYFPAADLVPEVLPLPSVMRDRHEAMTGGAREVNRYGFQVFCRPGCPFAQVFTEVAYQEAAERDALSNYVAGFATEHVSVEIVRVDRDGRTAWRTEYLEDETGTFAGILPMGASPDPVPTAPRPAASSPWAMPSAPAAATGISLVAVLGGLLYYFWPALKNAAGVGLFSRIRDDKVLDHPQRARLMEAIRADPGVHFQELCRRMGLGHGVLEHHVRKLVDAELVVVRRTSGYTCYFPKATDRRMMDAAPMLRSGGSRAVLRAVAAKPGTSSRDLAVHLGLAPSTVSYHLKRLETAGLVLPDPVAGARLTPLGEQAKVQG